MKLAEALSERKAIKTSMEELKKRIYQNARIQEGDSPIEDVDELLVELQQLANSFELLVARIHNTNNVTRLENGMTLMEAILKKDMLHYQQFIYRNLADKASVSNPRFSRREIKMVPAVDISEIHQKARELAKSYRQLDLQIQAANWETDLL